MTGWLVYPPLLLSRELFGSVHCNKRLRIIINAYVGITV